VALTAKQQAGSYFARKRNRLARKSAPVADHAGFAVGSITFSSNASQSVTLGGTVVNLSIGASLADTLAALLVTLGASADANIIKCTYAIEGSTLVVTSKMRGDATFTLAASAGTRSGATLVLPTITARAKL
jgi:CBS domain containing-hemolysin-like protein